MDKQGYIKEHSKIKLELYRLYLERYLWVLLNSKAFSQIVVHDIFAGSGKSLNSENGSALISAIEINKIRNDFPLTQIKLMANEYDQSSYAQLTKNLEPFPFKTLSNLDADGYIQKWIPASGTHNFFF